MTATTIHSFPSLHSWNSPRSWALAIIALLHLGFFWALTNGLSTSMITKVFSPLPPQYIAPTVKPTPPPPKPIDYEFKPTPVTVTHVEPNPLIDIRETETAPIVAPIPTPPNTFGGGDVAPPEPVVVEPRIGARGLSEPYYPPDVIRRGGEGTVLLSIYILADGRVGDVKLERSSGHTKLDDSAMREAKKWRFVPGTRDGAPVSMWKQVPITFRLNNN
jgi:protein TonB